LLGHAWTVIPRIVTQVIPGNRHLQCAINHEASGTNPEDDHVK